MAENANSSASSEATAEMPSPSRVLSQDGALGEHALPGDGALGALGLPDLIAAQSVCARMAIEVPLPVDGKAPRAFMWMPGGVHTICGMSDGQEKELTVSVDRETAVNMQRALSAWLANDSRRPFFDFDHERKVASAWPESFAWQDAPRPGVYVTASWSEAGERAVVGKNYRGFSPEFYPDREDGSKLAPAKVVFFPLTVGGLTNKPAFQKNAAFWAHQAEAGRPNGTNGNGALGEHALPGDGALGERALPGDGALGEHALPSISAAVAAAAVNQNKIENMSESNKAAAVSTAAEVGAVTAANEIIDLRAKLAAADGVIAGQRKRDAVAAVQAAVKRGALPAQDTALHGKWEGWCVSSPDMIAALDAIPGVPAVTAGQMTTGQPAGRLDVFEGPKRTVQAYGEVMKRNRAVKGVTASACEQRGALAREAAAIYAAIRRNLSEIGEMPVTAATTTDTDAGSMAGDLVTQRTLELLKYQFPALSRVSTDFSDQPASYGQTIISRYMTIPTIATYSTTTGWTTPGSNPTATDASVVINAHKGVPIRFQENQLAGTMRRLFDEFAPASAYALAKDMVDALYALITVGNFASTAVKADVSGFGRGEVIDIGTALQKRGVPIGPNNRTLLLNSDYFGALAKDSAIVTLSAFQKSDIIEQGILPNVHGFGVVDAPNLPATGNLAGFGFSKSALVIAARLPNDYSSILPGASYGNVTTITDPDLGLSVMQVQYVDHKLGFAESRIALMYGVAVGQGNAGQRLISA